MVGSHRELEVVLGELTLRVLDVQDHSGVVDQRRQLLATSSETADERPNRLQVCKVQLYTVHRHHAAILTAPYHLYSFI